MYCPRCGRQLNDESIFCQYCGFQIKESDFGPVDANGHNNDSTSSASSSSNVSVDSTRDKKFKPGRLILLAVVIIAAIVGYNSYQAEQNERKAIAAYSSYLKSEKEYQRQKEQEEFNYTLQRNKDLALSVNSVYSNSSYTICEGSLKNNGSKTYEFIQVKGSFMNADGEVLDTDWTYAVGGEGLSAGETTTFRLSVTKNNNIKDCKVTFME